MRISDNLVFRVFWWNTIVQILRAKLQGILVLVCLVINLILCFHFDAMAEFGAFMRTDFIYFCIKSSIGTQGEVG